MGIISKIKGLKPAKTIHPPNANFLNSDEYETHMLKHLPFGQVYDLHEAQNKTLNYQYRHHELNHQLGIFRWRGIYKHKDLILKYVNDKNLKIVDLGGAACPLGFHSDIVDFLPKDASGKPVKYKYLADLPYKADVIFTSHTLEHIEPLEEVVQQIADALVDGGHLMAHVPSFYCERWRSNIHTNRKYNDHAWTFGLSDSKIPTDLKNYLAIDTILEKQFDLSIAEFCGDDSIFIFGRKKS
jgi:SAM-dependent methyltransferase